MHYAGGGSAARALGPQMHKPEREPWTVAGLPSVARRRSEPALAFRLAGVGEETPEKDTDPVFLTERIFVVFFSFFRQHLSVVDSRVLNAPLEAARFLFLFGS